MTTKVQKSVVVDVPLSTAYNQWTQFEEFPRFMDGVESVTQLTDDRLEWVAEIAGVRRQWIAKILEQVPDRKVAWAAVEGATNAGAVTFDESGPSRTAVHLELEYEPEGLLENLGDKLKIVERQAEGDLGRFKDFVESHPRASGGWREPINKGATTQTPGVEDAASSYGDSGKVGDSGWDPAVDDDADAGLGVLDPAEGEDADRPGLIGTTGTGVPSGTGDRDLNTTGTAAGGSQDSVDVDAEEDRRLFQEPGLAPGSDDLGRRGQV